MRCFWCGAEGVQHREPYDSACLGADDAAMATALERAAEGLAILQQADEEIERAQAEGTDHYPGNER